MEILSYITKQLALFNWIDWLIIFVVVVYAMEGFFTGFVISVLDIVGFSLSFFIALILYRIFGGLLVNVFHGPEGIIYTSTFIIIAIVVELVLRLFISLLIKKIHAASFAKTDLFKQTNKTLGVIPGVFSGILLITFFLIVFVSFPFSPVLKHTISTSRFGNTFIGNAQSAEKIISSILGEKGASQLTFVTVSDEDKKTMSLHFTFANGRRDKYSEDMMVTLVNYERAKRGLPQLSVNEKLAEIAREHAQDMLKKGYFSHYSLNGKSPFDRMNDANIPYLFAGENLALSPNVTLAMQGLMASPGHRANILSKDFGQIGVGVIDAGIYGEMFVQEFTD